MNCMLLILTNKCHKLKSTIMIHIAWLQGNVHRTVLVPKCYGFRSFDRKEQDQIAL